MVSEKERYIHPADQIKATTEKLIHHWGYQLTLLDFCTAVSCVDEEGTFWISQTMKPSLTEKVEVVSLSTEGVWSPQPYEQPIVHSSIYEARSECKAVIQAHSTALESFSLCSLVPNTKTLDQIFTICGAPAFIEYAMTPDALNSFIYQTFKDPNVRCALSIGNGVICAGKNLREAFQIFETLDFCARMVLRATRIGIPASLSDEQLAYHRFLASVMSFEDDTFAYRGISSTEKQFRSDIIQCLQKCLKQNLMSSTGGSISIRLSSNSILITPTGIDRHSIEAHDLLLVRQELNQQTFSIVHWYQERKDLIPSRALKAHFAIYNRHNWVQSIISSHPLNVAALCSVRSGLESRFMPPPYSSLAQILPLPYDSCLDAERVAACFDETELGRVGSVLVCNDGAITIGENINSTMEKLEVLESVCSIAIDAHTLGCKDFNMFLPSKEA